MIVNITINPIKFQQRNLNVIYILNCLFFLNTWIILHIYSSFWRRNNRYIWKTMSLMRMLMWIDSWMMSCKKVIWTRIVILILLFFLYFRSMWHIVPVIMNMTIVITICHETLLDWHIKIYRRNYLIILRNRTSIFISLVIHIHWDIIVLIYYYRWLLLGLSTFYWYLFWWFFTLDIAMYIFFDNFSRNPFKRTLRFLEFRWIIINFFRRW